MTLTQLSIAFFLQVAVILVTCRLVGTAAQRWLGQPRVVGEMIAGVLLGPSLLGALAPEVQGFLFPKESKPILFVIAQFGVGLYMFLVGLGFDRNEFFKGAKGAAAVSLAGMAAPFAVAVAIALAWPSASRASASPSAPTARWKDWRSPWSGSALWSS